MEFEVEVPWSMSMDDVKYHFTVTWGLSVLEIKILPDLVTRRYWIKVDDPDGIVERMPSELYSLEGRLRLFR